MKEEGRARREPVRRRDCAFNCTETGGLLKSYLSLLLIPAALPELITKGRKNYISPVKKFPVKNLLKSRAMNPKDASEV